MHIKQSMLLLMINLLSFNLNGMNIPRDYIPVSITNNSSRLIPYLYCMLENYDRNKEPKEYSSDILPETTTRKSAIEAILGIRNTHFMEIYTSKGIFHIDAIGGCEVRSSWSYAKKINSRWEEFHQIVQSMPIQQVSFIAAIIHEDESVTFEVPSYTPNDGRPTASLGLYKKLSNFAVYGTP